MSALTNDQYRSTEEDFKIAFGICRSLLSSDAVKDVEHYLEHGELELAYESFGLSLKAEGVEVPKSAKELLLPMGPVLGVDKEGVLNANFWKEVLPILGGNE